MLQKCDKNHGFNVDIYTTIVKLRRNLDNVKPNNVNWLL